MVMGDERLFRQSGEVRARKSVLRNSDTYILNAR